MKISCTQENLNQGLFVVSHVASKNTSLPILNNILINTKNNQIKLTATNLEIGVSCEIRGKSEEDGDLTIQSKLLADYVSLLPKERVDLSTTSNEQGVVLGIKCKNHSTKIKSQPATDFPLIPVVERKNPFNLDPVDFREALSQIIFATSISETRPEINGVFFKLSNNGLTMAATDSYRLAEKKVGFKKPSSGGNQEVIVPTKTLQELQRILSSFKDPAAISEIEGVDLYLSDNQILFVLGNIEIVSRLVEGQYPDYTQIIPQTSNTTVKFNVTELVNAVKTNSLFARSGIYDVSLEIFTDKSEIVVHSANSQLGENTTTLAVTTSGDNNNIVVNFRYLLDGLQNIGSDEAELSLVDAASPCLLKPVSKNPDYLYIIMPIKQ